MRAFAILIENLTTTTIEAIRQAVQEEGPTLLGFIRLMILLLAALRLSFLKAAPRARRVRGVAADFGIPAPGDFVLHVTLWRAEWKSLSTP